MTEEKENKSALKTNYFQVPNEIFDLDLPNNEKLAYIYLCRCGNQGSDAFPSYTTIARKCGISRMTAVRVIKNLESKNLIKVERRPKSNKDNHPNKYHLPSITVIPGASITETPASNTVIPYKELPDKELNLYKEPTGTGSFHPDELKKRSSSENPLPFLTFIKQYEISERAERVIKAFLSKYARKRKEQHPDLTADKWGEFADRLFYFDDDADRTIELEEDDLYTMIDYYFEQSYQGGCNYRLGHFSSNGVRKVLFYERCY